MDFQDCVDISLDDVVPLFSPGFSTVQSILGGRFGMGQGHQATMPRSCFTALTAWTKSREHAVRNAWT